jgi:acetylcholinesterase
MFTPKNLSTDEDFTNFFHTLLPGLSELDLRQLNKVYPDPIVNPSSKFLDTRPPMYGVGPQFKRAEQAYAHFAYIAPTRQTADFAAKLDVPVYLYHFAVNSSIKDGCNHGDHAGFATYNPDIRMKSETFEKISGLMHAYWTSFITTGDPNRVKGRYPDRPQWPAYVSAGKKIVFGDGNDEKAGGGHKGTVVKIDDDTWSAEENKYWWARTELFEL